MQSSLRAVIVFLREFNWFEGALLISVSSAVVFVLRRRLIRCLPIREVRSILPFAAKSDAPGRVAERCEAITANLRAVERDAGKRVGSRLKALNRLIAEADREITRLRSHLRDEDATSPTSRERTQRSQNERLVNWLNRTFRRRPDFEFDVASDADGHPSGPTIGEIPSERPAVCDLHARMIRDLGRAGHSAEAIAALAKRPVAEIERLLNDGSPGGLGDAA
mgnify:CR=1 FL=1